MVQLPPSSSTFLPFFNLPFYPIFKGEKNFFLLQQAGLLGQRKPQIVFYRYLRVVKIKLLNFALPFVCIYANKKSLGARHVCLSIYSYVYSLQPFHRSESNLKQWFPGTWRPTRFNLISKYLVPTWLQVLLIHYSGAHEFGSCFRFPFLTAESLFFASSCSKTHDAHS